MSRYSGCNQRSSCDMWWIFCIPFIVMEWRLRNRCGTVLWYSGIVYFSKIQGTGYIL